MACVEDLISSHDTVNPNVVHMIILHDAAIINMTNPGICNTFEEYVMKVME